MMPRSRALSSICVSSTMSLRAMWKRDGAIACANPLIKSQEAQFRQPGRVYTGKQALDLGLIDTIGGLEQALDNAAAKASLEGYDVRVIPRPQDFLTQLMEQLSGDGQRPSDVSLSDMGRVLTSDPTWKTLFGALQKTDPQRARALYQAVQRIDLIGQEGVILMMPNDIILR